jgi:putative flippase GtrA
MAPLRASPQIGTAQTEDACSVKAQQMAWEGLQHMVSPLGTFIRSERFRSFLGFFAGAAVGLAIDLIGFKILVVVGLEPWLANGISSFTSISAVYLIVTRYAFGAGTKVSTYVLFVGWYCLNIVVMSTLIQLMAHATGWDPFIWKLISVPVSFVLNYLFSQFLFRDRNKSVVELLDGEPEET